MSAYKLLDFKDLYTAISEELKIQLSDTTSINRIKRVINMVYLDEVAPRSRWNWLLGQTVVRHKISYSSGTCAILPNTNTVTLSVPPAVTSGDSGSFKGWYFTIDGQNEIYRIASHTALSATLTLEATYNGNQVTQSAFKIFQEDLALPTDCRETIELYYDQRATPMVGKGLQEFRKIQSSAPKTIERPAYYTTYDFADPSEGDGETESDRYRVLKVWPAISNYTTLIKVDYVKDITPLETDGDEPVMPVEDRIVLYYGALSILWASIGRNPEEAARNAALYEAKISRMLGKITDSMDKPRVEPDSSYIVAKRGSRIGVYSRKGLGPGAGGSATFNSPTYLENVTINGAQVTANVTVNPGITIDTRDISADGLALDAHIAATANVHGVTGAIVGADMVQTLTNKTIDASVNSISNITDAEVASGAAIARSKLASGTPSVLVVNDGSGVLSDSAVATSALDYLADAVSLTSVTLTDNIAVPAVAISIPVATATVVHIEYSLLRGAANIEAGVIKLVTDGTSAAIAQGAAASLGTLGVTLTADVSAGNLRLLYETTSTGTNATLKYKLQRWLA